MKELTIKASLDHLAAVMAFVDAELEELGCSMKTQYQIDVAVDELFSNISQYAYTPNEGSATLRLESDREAGVISITFIDSGVPFNPLLKKDPDVTQSVEDREIGGLGIFIVKKSMDAMHYEYRNGQNILSIKKKL